MSVDYQHIRSKILWSMALVGIAMLLVMSVHRKSQAHVKSLDVHIKPIKGEHNLIDEKEIGVVFKKFLGYDVLEANIKDLDLKELEELIVADKRVKRAEVFVDAHNHLSVWIVQRQPVVRVVDSKTFSYYIDEEGNDIPTRKGLAVRVPLATGNIDLYDLDKINSDKKSSLKNVYTVAKYIMADEFLKALIEQIDVNDNKDLVLIPKIGRQYILFGDSENLETKFNSLKAMYKNGLPTVGWTKYKGINVKYNGVLYGIM